MVQQYHSHLYKEYVLADLTTRPGQVGLQWRTRAEVESGRGHTTCGNKFCRCTSCSPENSSKTDLLLRNYFSSAISNSEFEERKLLENIPRYRHVAGKWLWTTYGRMPWWSRWYFMKLTLSMDKCCSTIRRIISKWLQWRCDLLCPQSDKHLTLIAAPPSSHKTIYTSQATSTTREEWTHPHPKNSTRNGSKISTKTTNAATTTTSNDQTNRIKVAFANSNAHAGVARSWSVVFCKSRRLRMATIWKRKTISQSLCADL